MLQHPRQHQIRLVNIGHVGRLAQRPAGSSEHGQCGSVPFRRIRGPTRTRKRSPTRTDLPFIFLGQIVVVAH